MMQQPCEFSHILSIEKIFSRYSHVISKCMLHCRTNHEKKSMCMVVCCIVLHATSLLRRKRMERTARSSAVVVESAPPYRPRARDVLRAPGRDVLLRRTRLAPPLGVDDLLQLDEDCVLPRLADDRHEAGGGAVHLRHGDHALRGRRGEGPRLVGAVEALHPMRASMRDSASNTAACASS